ncbi:hypothetical protein AB0I81_23610 [Nonomuraea sp. NPDC050404]|uniref:hypothetical protein n=1 Tax=Nonomuraea sp. NPDC050404 TaxID=3155783 RepID=UPI0033E834C2
MSRSTRITAVALAGAFALATLATPAAANVPSSIDTAVNAFNGNFAGNNVPVCVPGEVAGLGVQVPIISPKKATCTQH